MSLGQISILGSARKYTHATTKTFSPSWRPYMLPLYFPAFEIQAFIATKYSLLLLWTKCMLLGFLLHFSDYRACVYGRMPQALSNGTEKIHSTCAAYSKVGHGTHLLESNWQCMTRRSTVIQISLHGYDYEFSWIWNGRRSISTYTGMHQSMLNVVRSHKVMHWASSHRNRICDSARYARVVRFTVYYEILFIKNVQMAQLQYT